MFQQVGFRFAHAYMPVLEPAFVTLSQETCQALSASQLFSEHVPAKVGSSATEISSGVEWLRNAVIEETSNQETCNVDQEMDQLPDAVSAAIAALCLDDISNGHEHESSSIGSIGHHMGSCRPCAWRWKPSGCVKAESCEFCHLCEKGARKTRKKERIADIRMWKAMKKMLPVGRLDPNRIIDARVINL